ncbi:hypothetical protein K458DRAFT_123267 [Lentithecium fluviatile CBS 122367]|uniref:Uncharacterized protein n=1 Tax=Lentithecium fluviatile CBS 122367 TaxID=1168545 RepID=A0A6G1JFY7_9PLEO|nr:hypothetical protein K458DRAFT_123267 [Lentithecium fluviatile CBS 122367]
MSSVVASFSDINTTSPSLLQLLVLYSRRDAEQRSLSVTAPSWSAQPRHLMFVYLSWRPTSAAPDSTSISTFRSGWATSPLWKPGTPLSSSFRKNWVQRTESISPIQSPKTLSTMSVQFEESHQKSSKSRRILAKIQPLVNAISDYGKALDVMANSSTVIPLLWGSLRVLVLAAKRYDDYFIHIIEMLERIGDVLPRYSTYATLFGSRAPLRNALEAVCLQILKFVAHAMKVLTCASGRTIIKSAWKSFEEAFRDSILQLRRSRELVEDEAKLASMIEQMQEKERAEQERRRAAESRKKVERLEMIVTEQEKYAAIRWLNARGCDDSREAIQNDRLLESCRWIMDRDELTSWLQDAEKQFFWLHGAAGCGKSYLYSKILDRLETRNPTLSFLFCGGDRERTTFSALLRSWCLQLIELNPQMLQHLNFGRQRKGNTTASDNEIIDLLETLLDRVPLCFLTVDAIDECSDSENFFKRLSFVPKRFKVLITSRTPARMHGDPIRLRGSIQTLEIQPEMLQNDIDHFVTASLSDLEVECSDITKIRIKRRLSRCEGMFLLGQAHA